MQIFHISWQTWSPKFCAEKLLGDFSANPVMCNLAFCYLAIPLAICKHSFAVFLKNDLMNG